MGSLFLFYFLLSSLFPRERPPLFSCCLYWFSVFVLSILPVGGGYSYDEVPGAGWVFYARCCLCRLFWRVLPVRRSSLDPYLGCLCYVQWYSLMCCSVLVIGRCARLTGACPMLMFNYLLRASAISGFLTMSDCMDLFFNVLRYRLSGPICFNTVSTGSVVQMS